MMPEAELPIGIFDSGIGGLTVVRQIHRLLPHEDLVYLGDTARVPYGTKSPGTVIRFAYEDTLFLLQQNVKAVVVACNTASAWALPRLQAKFKCPIMGVILPGAAAALRASPTGRIGVIGTSATMRSGAYDQAIHADQPTAKVFSQACPLLVPLVEEGWLTHKVTTAVLREYLDPLLKRGIDTLILGCTHYPLLKRAIRSVTGKSLRLVDSAESCAQVLCEQLEHLQLLHPTRCTEGTIKPFVTDESARFDQIAHRFLGSTAPPARQVELPTTP